MNQKTIDQLKRATREKYPVAKGDVVCVIVTHRSVVSQYGRNVLAVSPTDYSSFHLGRVVKATRQGRAEKVQLVGHPGAPVAAYDRLTRTLAITDKQAAARALAATMDVPGTNEFASADHLKTAILAHDGVTAS